MSQNEAAAARQNPETFHSTDPTSPNSLALARLGQAFPYWGTRFEARARPPLTHSTAGYTARTLLLCSSSRTAVLMMFRAI